MTEIRDVLVGLLKEKISLDILKTQGWYHIPVKTKIQNWPPRILAFYQGYRFGSESLRICYYGEVDKIETVPRKALFPNDEKNAYKADSLYYKLTIKNLLERNRPIVGHRPRAWIFIYTNMERFDNAVQTNDLFIGSYLEEEFWTSLKRENIFAEREWELKINNHKYYVDFAVFCNQGKLAIETDGYTTHYDSREKIDYDSWRRNEIGLDEWHILQYTPKHVNDASKPYLTQVHEFIERHGGQESPEDFNKNIIRKIGEEPGKYNFHDDDYD